MKIKNSTRNTNKHTEKGMELLSTSIDKIGVIESVSVATDGTIISGHARREMFEKKGMQPKEIHLAENEYPVIVTKIENNSKQYFEAQILANTTANVNLNIDFDMVDEIAEEIGIDIVDYGFDVEAIEEIETETETDSGPHNTKPQNMIMVTLTDAENIEWNKCKELLSITNDKKCIFALINNFNKKNND